MKIWCWKNKYLIASRHNQGIITRHTTRDCVDCTEENCLLFKSTRGLTPHSINLYLRWLGDSPAEVIAYHEGYDILRNKKFDDTEYTSFKLLLSFPPELYDSYWSSISLKIQNNEELDAKAELDIILERILIEYDNWDPLKPYWENLTMRKKHG